MSGADEAIEALQRVARRSYAPTLTSGKALASAHRDALAATDVVAMMQTVVRLIDAAEDLARTSGDAAKALREQLGATMNDVGCTQVQTNHRMAYLSRKAAFVNIEQEDMVPSSYLVTPPPALDKKQIKSDLEAGQLVPGCTLIRPNSLQLNIKSKKE